MSSLAGQPPPRPGAEPGFYPDPLGSNRGRWWDGSAWTLRVGPPVPAGAPLDRALDPPVKTCPRCGVESRTFASNCPNCGRDFRLTRGMIAGLVAAAVALVLLLGGCAVLAATVDVADDDISREDFQSVQLGATIESVEDEFGDPLEREEFLDAGTTVRCLEYADEDDLDATYDFCFVGDRLVRKIEHD